MSHVTYKVVQHDGGWAYTVDGVFSEPFPNHAAALAAARRVAAERTMDYLSSLAAAMPPVGVTRSGGARR